MSTMMAIFLQLVKIRNERKWNKNIEEICNKKKRRNLAFPFFEVNVWIHVMKKSARLIRDRMSLISKNDLQMLNVGLLSQMKRKL